MREALRLAAEATVKETAWMEYRIRALDDDSIVNEIVAKSSYRATPWLRAGVYGVKDGESVWGLWDKYKVLPLEQFIYREKLADGRTLVFDERTASVPVFMRGSKLCLEHKYSVRTGIGTHGAEYAEKHIKRYLRKQHFTSFSFDHIEREINSTTMRLRPYLHYQTQRCLKQSLGIQRPIGFYGNTCYINGIYYNVDDSIEWRVLKQQERLRQKILKLEARTWNY